MAGMSADTKGFFRRGRDVYGTYEKNAFASYWNVAMAAVAAFGSQLLSVSTMTCLVVCAYIQNYRIPYQFWRVDKAVSHVAKSFYSLFEDDEQDEQCVMNERYYAEKYGYTFETHEVNTEDGFILQVHRIFKSSARDAGCPLRPVVLQHGLFQCSGIFILNETDSLAFYLAERGYDVWLGNNRCVSPKHKFLTPNDEEYWDWCLDDLAKYDWPAIIKFVSAKTNTPQITYVGHSQGNAQAFLGLSHDPKLSEKLKLFVAIAPAFHINPPKHWALQAMVKMSKEMFVGIFGKKSFVPIMSFMQQQLPATLFSHIAFNMFCYLFNWGDHRWQSSRKCKYFLFTPRPTSCKLLMHWSDIIKTGTLHMYNNGAAEKKKACVSDIKCKTAVFYSSEDSLVHGDALVKDMEKKKVPLFHVERVNEYEHMDLIWAKDTPQSVFSKLVEVLERAHSE